MEKLKKYPVNIGEIIKSEKIVYSKLNKSMMLNYKNLSDITGANIYIKHENQNFGGSFKIRGGVNLMHHIKENNIKGVITFSTGNHGISIAASAKIYGIDAVIVVPEGTNENKKALILEQGAELIVAGKTFEEASEVVERLSSERGLYYVHAANEPHLINGVGTEFLEIIRDLPDVDVVILPIGAGSELAAAITVFKAIKPDVEIIAVQAKASQAAYMSWKKGVIMSAENKTFAGGFATGTAYELPFSIYKDSLSDFVILSEEEIEKGIVYAMEYTQNYAEGAGASTIMAAMKLKDRLKGKNVVLQMSGRNLSMSKLREIIKWDN